MRKLKYLLLIFMLVPLMFGQYEIPIENLLTNSGFGVWSQADANAGIAALTYDTGSAGGGDIPDVGDAVTGGASGATGKIMSMTIATGSFATNNATGVIQLGSTTGCFNDDEALAFTDGETAVVNHPNNAVGADKIMKNGDFTHIADDPPTSWTFAAAALLSTEAGGQVGNCMKVKENGADLPYARTDFCTVSPGKIYKLSFYHKDIDGTADNPQWRVYDITNLADIKSWTTETAAAAWTQVIFTFEAPAGCVQAQIRLKHQAANGDADAYYFDEVTLYEITNGCTGADAKALDLWVKDTTIDIYREHNGANTKDGSFYALKMVVTTASDYVRWPGAFYNQEEWYMQFQGRTVTKGKWVKTSTANHAKITITDSAGSTSSSFHTGGGAFEWLKVTRTIDASATSFAIYIYGDIAGTIDGNTIIYISQPMLCFQSSIGSGNYSPRQHEVIWTEAAISSNKLHALNNQSDSGWLDLNIEADSNGRLPKGCKAIQIFSRVRDSAGSAVDCGLEIRKNVTAGFLYFNSPYGLGDNRYNIELGWQPCDSNGDIDYNIDATGANTFRILYFWYSAVQVTD